MNDKTFHAKPFFSAGSLGSRLLAAIFLVYFAPLMLAVAFLIKFEASGPVFLRRSRCMPNRGSVDLWEFRTSVSDGGRFGITRQNHHSALGDFLRASRLDMLPRLLNMLRGEVSFGLLFR